MEVAIPMGRLSLQHQILFFCGAIMAPSFLLGVFVLLLGWGASLTVRPGDNGRGLRLLLRENLQGDLSSFLGQHPGQKARHGGI